MTSIISRNHMKPSFIFLVLGLSLSIQANDKICAIPGESIHWVVDYCMYIAETDDFLNPAVQDCLLKQDTKKMGSCEIKIKYKKEMCKMMSVDFNSSWEKCMADKTYSGPTVRNGGV